MKWKSRLLFWLIIGVGCCGVTAWLFLTESDSTYYYSRKFGMTPGVENFVVIREMHSGPLALVVPRQDYDDNASVSLKICDSSGKMICDQKVILKYAEKDDPFLKDKGIIIYRQNDWVKSLKDQILFVTLSPENTSIPTFTICYLVNWKYRYLDGIGVVQKKAPNVHENAKQL